MLMDLTHCEHLTPHGRTFLLAVAALCDEYGVCLSVDGQAAMILMPAAAVQSATPFLASTIIDDLGREGDTP
jgi:hypothetical protein